jgi:tetratricopeptide (TPR) repeat protein
MAYRYKGEHDRSIADFSTLIDLEPDNYGHPADRCWARAIANKDLGSALLDCDRSLRMKPDNYVTLDNRAFTYYRLGRLDEALADYEAALKLKPDYSYSLYGRGLVKIKKGDREGGLADIEQAKKNSSFLQGEFEKYGVSP